MCERFCNGDPGNAEQSALLLIHGHVPNGLTVVFHAVTVTGSTIFSIPVTAAVVTGLLVTHWHIAAGVAVVVSFATTFALRLFIHGQGPKARF